MDDAAIGRILRAIRQRTGLRQVDVGAKAGLSQPLVSVVESSGLERVSVRVARRLVRAVGAELVITVRWRGAEIDRLRDEAHASVVGAVAALLEGDGWLTAAEVTYSWYGERGSIDLLAFHPATRTLLVIEVKTEIASVEETLRRHDQKVRLASRVARERFGWDARTTARLLAIQDTRTARRRMDSPRGRVRACLPGPGLGRPGVAPRTGGPGRPGAVPVSHHGAWWPSGCCQPSPGPGAWDGIGCRVRAGRSGADRRVAGRSRRTSTTRVGG